MKVPLLAASIAAAMVMASAAGAEETCDRIAVFHSAPFDPTVVPLGRRWVEMRWVGGWLDFENGFGLECISSPDEGSKRLCGWLIENTSIEFQTNLPARILECWDYRFPRPLPSWGEWRSQMSHLEDDRWMTLEVDLTEGQGDPPAVRLSSFAMDKDEITVELPNLRPAPELRGTVASVSRGYWND